MEDKLLILGGILWFYQRFLSQALLSQDKKDLKFSSPVAYLFNSLFFSSIGVLVALTLHSYLGYIKGETRVSLVGGIGGWIFGWAYARLATKGQAEIKRLLVSDLEWAKS